MGIIVKLIGYKVSRHFDCILVPRTRTLVPHIFANKSHLLTPAASHDSAKPPATTLEQAIRVELDLLRRPKLLCCPNLISEPPGRYDLVCAGKDFGLVSAPNLMSCNPPDPFDL